MSDKDKKGFFDLNGHRYKVFFENLEKFKDEDTEDEDVLFGMVNHSQLSVAIDNTVAKTKQEETLIHEISHCILTPAGYENNERLIRALSTGLNQLGIGKYLMKKVKRSREK